MSRRSDHSRDGIREMALTAAAAIIDEQGYGALSTRKLAARIGYTVGTLYLVFHNLDDLMLQVNVRTLDILYQRLAAAAENCTTGPEGLLVLGRSYLEFATTHPNRWGALFEHNLSPDATVPDWYLASVARNFELVEALLHRSAPQRSAPEIAKAARTLWGGVHGVCILGLTRRLGGLGEASLDELMESLITNYLSGFCSA